MTVMNHDEFESQLRGQKLRALPTEWRAEILAAATQRVCPRPELSPTKLVRPASGWLGLFWPHPAAWAGVGAVWVGIVFMRFAMSDPKAEFARSVPPPSTQMVLVLREQQPQQEQQVQQP